MAADLSTIVPAVINCLISPARGANGASRRGSGRERAAAPWVGGRSCRFAKLHWPKNRRAGRDNSPTTTLPVYRHPGRKSRPRRFFGGGVSPKPRGQMPVGRFCKTRVALNSSLPKKPKVQPSSRCVMVELMNNRVAGQAFRVAAFAGLVLGSASLAGCSTMGLGGDVTGSTGTYVSSGSPQSMPRPLAPIGGSRTDVASGPYIPPEDIAGSGAGGLVTGSLPAGTISSSALPPLTGNAKMSAQPSYAPLAAPKTAALGSMPINSSTPTLSAVPSN
eukprot:gene3590-4903_t